MSLALGLELSDWIAIVQAAVAATPKVIAAIHELKPEIAAFTERLGKITNHLVKTEGLSEDRAVAMVALACCHSPLALTREEKRWMDRASATVDGGG